MRGLPPPRPVDTAMYCLPPTLNVSGKPCTEVPRRVSHSILPVFTSTARNMRSMSPTNAMPPAVESTAVMNGARCSTFQISFIVRTSYAASLPTLPLVPGISKKRRAAPPPLPPPSTRSTFCAFISWQLWASGMISRLVPRMVAHGVPVVAAFRRGAALHPLADLVARRCRCGSAARPSCGS